jgi:hypothetical protein
MHDLKLAEGLCALLGSSIEPSTASNYRCGFRSLEKFCLKVGVPPLPVSAATLCLWMFKICGRKCKPATVAKYLSGVRHTHLLNGYDWTLSVNPLVQMTLRGLRKRYRADPKFQKVPLCLGTLLSMCRVMPGWPSASKMSFNDLLFATASSVAFAAGLRGGEFFTYPRSSRPLLRGKDISPVTSAGVDFLIVDVPKPKNRPFARSARTFASGSMQLKEFHPFFLLAAYRARAHSRGLRVLGKSAAFQFVDGSPLTRDFMVNHAETLRNKAGLSLINVKGKPVLIFAASWRAGYVLSAHSAGVTSDTIRKTGRWDSVEGPRPYTFDTATSLQTTADRIAACHIRLASTTTTTGGQFVSSSLFL